MNADATSYAAARDFMVDGQLRPNRIAEPRLIRALRELPRERFLPAHLASKAYQDEDVPLGGGRVLVEPLVLASLVQLARARAGDKALVVGAGTGYGAAVLAALGASVTALEEDGALLEIARRALPALAPSVVLTEGKLADGLPGPWDVIMIEGAVPAVPGAVGRHLRGHGGRLVTVLAQSPGLGQGVLAEAVDPSAAEPVLRARPFFDCATPWLPAFQPVRTFTF